MDRTSPIIRWSDEVGSRKDTQLQDFWYQWPRGQKQVQRGKTKEETTVGEEAGNQKFSFIYVKCKVPIKHLSGNVKKAVGNTTTVLRMETWDQNIHWSQKACGQYLKPWEGEKNCQGGAYKRRFKTVPWGIWSSRGQRRKRSNKPKERLQKAEEENVQVEEAHSTGSHWESRRGGQAGLSNTVAITGRPFQEQMQGHSRDWHLNEVSWGVGRWQSGGEKANNSSEKLYCASGGTGRTTDKLEDVQSRGSS